MSPLLIATICCLSTVLFIHLMVVRPLLKKIEYTEIVLSMIVAKLNIKQIKGFGEEIISAKKKVPKNILAELDDSIEIIYNDEKIIKEK